MARVGVNGCNPEIFAHIRCYAEYIGQYSQRFQEHLPILSSSEVKFDPRTWDYRLFRNLNNYQSTLRNIAEDRRSPLHCGGNLKSTTDIRLAKY
jgi:hypothetical protein